MCLVRKTGILQAHSVRTVITRKRFKLNRFGKLVFFIFFFNQLPKTPRRDVTINAVSFPMIYIARVCHVTRENRRPPANASRRPAEVKVNGALRAVVVVQLDRVRLENG